MLILLIEDDPGIIKLMTKNLNAMNHTVVQVETGKEAISKIIDSDIDLILLDYKLPDYDGKAFIKELIKVKEQIPPFIVTTGGGDERIAVEMMKLGARDYIVKDYEFWEIMPRIINRIEHEIESENKISKAEEKVKKGELLLSKAQSLANLCRWEYDVENDRLIWFDESYKLFGVDVREKNLNLQSFMDCIHPEDLEKVSDAYLGSLEKRAPGYRVEHRIIRPNDGEVRYVIEKCDHVFNDEGKVVKSLGMTQDITERKLAEEKISTSEERFSVIFNTAPLGIGVTINREISELNKHFLNMTGYNKEELIGQSARILYPSDEEFKRVGDVKYKQIAETGVGFINTKFKTKDGRILDIAMYSRPIDQEDWSKGVIFTTEDITSFKKMENDLKSSEEKFRALYENAPLAYQSLDIDGNMLDVNVHWLKTLGYTKEEVIGKSFGSFWPEEVQEYFPQKFCELKECGCKNDLQLQLKRKDGKILDVSYEAEVGYNIDGSFKQTYCVFKDITKEKKFARALEESEERFNLAISATSDGIFDWNLETNEIYYSPTWKKMIGYEDDELKNDFSVWETLIHPDDLKKSWQMLNEHISGDRARFEVDFRMKHKDGHWVEILSRASAIFNEEGKAVRVVGTHVDLTDKNEILKKLKDSESLLNETQKLSKIGGWEWDLKKRIMTWTDETYRIHGLEPGYSEFASEEFIGESIKCYDEGDREIVLSTFNKCVFEGIPYDLEFPFTTFEGKRIRVRTTAKAIKENGEIIKVIGNLMDVTEITKLQTELNNFFNQPISLNLIASFEGIIKKTNLGWENVLGYKPDELEGRPVLELIHEYDIEKTLHEVENLTQGATIFSFVNRYKHKNGYFKTIAWSGIANLEEQLIYSVGTDISEKIYLDSVNNARLYLYKYAVEHTLDDLLEETLNELEKLTESKIGFFHFVEDDQVTITLQNWSINTKNKFCKADIKGHQYSADKAGVWADCIKTKATVIHNDYESLTSKKGLPEGHAELIRELVVPVMRGEKVRAILGVGNKDYDYNKIDEELVSSFANLVFEIIERKKIEENLSLLNKAVDQSPLSIIITNKEGIITYVNEYFCYRSGYNSAEVIGEKPTILSSDLHNVEFYEDIRSHMKNGEIWKGEVCNKEKNGSLYWERCIIHPIKNEHGTVENYLALQEDITDQKNAQEELEEKIEKLERFNNVVVNRELKMVELKNEINELLVKQGLPKKYSTRK
ncbi:MAG: PAS domain S-box protein [Melioribacteraceae bacterium]|nr:PAS domain S-box protein [Melioribacteraceae bacterium]